MRRGSFEVLKFWSFEVLNGILSFLKTCSGDITEDWVRILACEFFLANGRSFIFFVIKCFSLLIFFCWQLGKTCIGSIAGGLSRMLPEMIQNRVKPSLKAGRRILKAWQKNKWPNLSNFNGGQGMKKKPQKEFLSLNLKMLPALRPELPRLSFAPFLVKASSGEVTLAPRVPSTFKKNFLFKQTCFSPPAKHTFFPEPFLRRESGPCGFPFNSSTDLYVFTCAQSIISVVGMIILFINMILHFVHILKCSSSHVILLTSELVVIPIVSPSSS